MRARLRYATVTGIVLMGLLLLLRHSVTIPPQPSDRVVDAALVSVGVVLAPTDTRSSAIVILLLELAARRPILHLVVWIPAEWTDTLCARRDLDTHGLCAAALRYRDVEHLLRMTSWQALHSAGNLIVTSTALSTSHVHRRVDGAAHRATILSSSDVWTAQWIGSLPLQALVAWHLPRVQIVVLAFQRVVSLQRLCQTLLAANYMGDEVDILFHVDAEGTTSNSAVLNYVSALPWPFGSKQLRPRVQHAGLLMSVMEAWYPGTNDEYAVFLEDDVSVSPQWYEFVKHALLTYRYGRGQGALLSRLYGISLYTPRLLELQYPRQRLDTFRMFPGSYPFLYPVPCSWGALYFPEQWRELHKHVHQQLRQLAPPVVVPGSASNAWTRSWKKFLIELAHLNEYVMLYPNFHNQTSFSTNHLEPGEHVDSADSQLAHLPVDYTVPLWAAPHYLTELGALPATLVALPTLNLFGRPVLLKN